MATLKISELSVGDWVQDQNGIYAKVIGIENWSNGYFLNIELHDVNVGVTPLASAHPIPITAEILENNGFVDIGSRLFPYEREWRGDKSAVNICSFDEELWFADFEFRDGRTCMSNIPLIYINQLQHILRLIEVDKEINL
jgi:hypothetical protein